jgi:hydroxymethylbilane synthase
VVEGEDGEELWLRAVVLSMDGALSVRMSISGPVTDAEELGTRLAGSMLVEGAADLMTASPEQGPPVRKQHA